MLEPDAAPSAPLSPAWRGAIRLSLGLAALFAGLQAAAILPLADDLPAWDEWILAPLWHAHYNGRPVLPTLIEPYNGHINLLPRLCFYGLGLLTHWNVRVEVQASYLACLFTVVLLLRLLRATDPRLLVLAAPVVAQAFSLQQYVNFSSGWPFGQMLAQLLLTASLYALVRPAGPALGAAAAAAVGASLSFAAALVVWPAGLLALLTGPRRRHALSVVLWLGLATGCWLLVSLGARGAGLSWLWSRLPVFALVMLGHVIGPQATSVPQALRLGALLVGLVALLTGLAVHAGEWRRLRPWLVLGLTSPGAALLIALGRAMFGPEQALASHYVTACYLFVVLALVALGLWTLAQPTPARCTLLALGALACVAQPGFVSWRWAGTLRVWAAGRREVSRALIEGTASDEQIRQAHHPDPELVRYGVKVLRRYGLAAFRHQGPTVLVVDPYQPPAVGGIAWPTRGRDGTPCLPVGRPARLNGWVVASREHGGPVDEVVATLDQQPVRLMTGFPRPDIARARGSDAFLRSGLRLELPPMSAGPHRLVVIARHAGRRTVLMDQDVPACDAPRP